MVKIKHQTKHQILKHLAETGFDIVSSDISAEDKQFLYTEIRKLIHAIDAYDEIDQCSCIVKRETDEVMSLDDAIQCLSDGHSVLTPEGAYQICKAVGVHYDKTKLEEHHYSDWGDFKGLHMNEGQEGLLGVYSLTLSRYVAEQLRVDDKAGRYSGRGFQAQAYSKQIRKYFDERR